MSQQRVPRAGFVRGGGQPGRREGRDGGGEGLGSSRRCRSCRRRCCCCRRRRCCCCCCCCCCSCRSSSRCCSRGPIDAGDVRQSIGPLPTAVLLLLPDVARRSSPVLLLGARPPGEPPPGRGLFDGCRQPDGGLEALEFRERRVAEDLFLIFFSFAGEGEEKVRRGRQRIKKEEREREGEKKCAKKAKRRGKQRTP